jgi:hypothetical protein
LLFHACSYTPPLPRLHFHASSYTPALTRLLLHACSCTQACSLQTETRCLSTSGTTEVAGGG